jgi:hypothetical protein
MVVLIGYLLRQYGVDRQRDQASLTWEQGRTRAAEERAEEALAAEKAAQAQVDVERSIRRHAESAAALAEAELAVQRMRVQWLMGEMDRMREAQGLPPGKENPA